MKPRYKEGGLVPVKPRYRLQKSKVVPGYWYCFDINGGFFDDYLIPML